ncbi:hypothetical protein OBBRIDRAFT_790131 [Obba rivulosa]|uniref:Nuclear GTPase SLIP-GC n=1 Tax=Obba rivulosa TaxID=1052685 RepID=A0A8E2J313_9APHY|nr:hypothetical protein OBBRIDRAFT_790131 [Obba rivulosa]
MSSKENEGMGSNMSVSDKKPKSEPRRDRAPPLPLTNPKARQMQIALDASASDSDASESSKLVVNSESVDVKPALVEGINIAGFAAFDETKPITMTETVVSDIAQIDNDRRAPTSPTPRQTPAPTPCPQATQSVAPYKTYEFAESIKYSPEDAWKEGLEKVDIIKMNMQNLNMGSKLRREIWEHDIESLQCKTTPVTVIAVCGATGAGKSSILNAVLDDNIVLTSGVRACTAVVTEIGYHNKKTIDAHVSFLSEEEWRQELGVLLDELVDEDGHVKRANNLQSDAGIAWQKVHAVYPTITQDMLAKMSIDDIIKHNRGVAANLGTTKYISAANSKEFTEAIEKYVESNEKRGGRKAEKFKGKDKSKNQEPSLADKDRNGERGCGTSNDPALWPLISQVKIKCNAHALSSGAILVDLPGVADANAARNTIAKDYMKNCDCIWILAPITRAVDNKDARGSSFQIFVKQFANYNASTITFIATKCDDISCSETIRALSPDLVEVEEKIRDVNDQLNEWKQKKVDAEYNIRAREKDMKEVKEHLKEYKEHLNALENGTKFEPRLTVVFDKRKKVKSPSGKKRKNGSSSAKCSPKKQKFDHIEDETMSVDDIDDFILDDDDAMVEVVDFELDSDNPDCIDKQNSDRDKNGSNSGSGSEDEDEEAGGVTIDSLKARIQEARDGLKANQSQLNEFRYHRKDVIGVLADLKKRQDEAQRKKNAVCSLRRSEFTRAALKEDFRQGLKDFDDTTAEQRDPDNFDPTVNQRNYDMIDLPVFTCTARDYVRITGQVQGDGSPTCFSQIEYTGIPELQQWCHYLTMPSRKHAVRNFLTDLRTLANSIHTYASSSDEVPAADREALRRKWKSTKVDITDRLIKDFKKVVEDRVQELQCRFKDGLEEKCEVGAAHAANVAVEISDKFAASMHWASYRATLRRHGSWYEDLNVELTNPFMRNIASTWSQIFESDLFASVETSTLTTIETLVGEVEASVTDSLKDCARAQAEICAEHARVALKRTLQLVQKTITTEQRDVSRCLVPHVQGLLVDGYDRAIKERGMGSVARQKLVFHNYVQEVKDEIFEDVAEVLMLRLDEAAAAVGKTLEGELNGYYGLARKVEMDLSVLWQGRRESLVQRKARVEAIATAEKIVRQVDLLLEAEQGKRVACPNTNVAVENGGTED